MKKLSDAHGSFAGQTTGELKASRVGRLVSSSAGFLLTPRTPLKGLFAEALENPI